MFMVLSSWRGHWKSSPGSFDECRQSARWPRTLKPSQPTWSMTPPVGCYQYHPHPPSPFLSITQPISWYSFYGTAEVQGWVDLCTAVRVCRTVSKAVYLSGCCDKHNCPRWDSNLGSFTPQLVMLLLKPLQPADAHGYEQLDSTVAGNQTINRRVGSPMP